MRPTVSFRNHIITAVYGRRSQCWSHFIQTQLSRESLLRISSMGDPGLRRSEDINPEQHRVLSLNMASICSLCLLWCFETISTNRSGIISNLKQWSRLDLKADMQKVEECVWQNVDGTKWKHRQDLIRDPLIFGFWGKWSTGFISCHKSLSVWRFFLLCGKTDRQLFEVAQIVCSCCEYGAWGGWCVQKFAHVDNLPKSNLCAIYAKTNLLLPLWRDPFLPFFFYMLASILRRTFETTPCR